MKFWECFGFVFTVAFAIYNIMSLIFFAYRHKKVKVNQKSVVF